MFYSKNGGASWKLLRTPVKPVGKLRWKPGRKQITESGLIQVCTVKTRKFRVVLCDNSDGPFAVRKR